MGNLSRSGSKVRKKGAPDPSPEGPNYSTIPFKFQTKVISNTERIGFNSQTKRFQEIEIQIEGEHEKYSNRYCNLPRHLPSMEDPNMAFSLNENPGPGCYNITHPSAVQNTVSQSRKGTCFFPSLDVRIARQRIPSYPAANAYDLPPTFQSKRDFSLGYSSMFQQPIARKISKRSTPAPNQYNVSRDLSKQNGYRGVKSVFTSKTKRSLTLYGKDRVPSPCHYEINDSFVRQAPTALVSCFRSRTKRETKPETLSPGPAAYQQPDKIPAATPRIKFPGLRKYGLNFSAPPLPRPKSPPSPGPGQYEIADFSGPQKHYISSAVFVSNTGRWSGDTFNEEVPGPGAYNLPIPRKQSFIYNAENKWLPAL